MAHLFRCRRHQVEVDPLKELLVCGLPLLGLSHGQAAVHRRVGADQEELLVRALEFNSTNCGFNGYKYSNQVFS